MDRWSGVLKVPLEPNSRNYYRVAASLCLSPSSRSPIVPSANAIFFNGDRVEGSRNPVIERLSDLQKVAEILVYKFGGSVNAWVIEASVFNGPFAVYRDFIPSINRWGEPKSYSPIGFPASTATVSILTNCFKEAKNVISRDQIEGYVPTNSSSQLLSPKTFVLGFSKGGTVLNQLVTELSFSEAKPTAEPPITKGQPLTGEFSRTEEEVEIIPSRKENLLNSIAEIHYVDVGLNSSGAYITDQNIIDRLSKCLMQRGGGIRFVIHGTPRQWCDGRRALIRKEKDRLIHLLESEARRSGERLQVCERFYFSDRAPDMQMHFEIIEALDVT